jgi:hypothetical protein
MPIPKNTRTDNPLTDHDDEKPKPTPTREEAIERVETRDDESPKEKVLSVDPPEEDDDDERSPTPRQQRRRARYDEIQTRAAEAEERARRAEQLAAALQAQQMVQPRERQTDPFEDEKKKLEEDWMKHLALADTLAKGSTADQQSQWKRDHLALQERQQTLVTRKLMAEAGVVPGQRVNHQEEAIKAHISAHFPDIAAMNPDGTPRNARALVYADGVLRQRLAREGRSAPTIKDYEEALQQTRRDLRMPGATGPAPSESTREKFSGRGLGGATGATSPSREIRMTSAEMKMAEAMYRQERDPKSGKMRKLKPEEAHAKWAQKVGKRIVEQRRAGG